MTVYIDPPDWPGHGRMWSHLVSDVSYAELHAFADRSGVPRRAFERDLPHSRLRSSGGTPIDIPSHRYAELVAAGAVEVSSREVVRLLTAAGLRRRKHGGVSG
ncbi:DUF4031 domain-containing protein [Streptomyces sp. NBC_00704]|uniref:DUF4031 domain-containing protein n=1 Tax=Streptomyces sp. NBC_00704 TaxID=2975809 RepID=UPI002E3321BB|nr:DUF4031 domain-containing protein [Streptomyces sp. NBC_00704]